MEALTELVVGLAYFKADNPQRALAQFWLAMSAWPDEESERKSD
jgi:hypothetical protein